MLDEQKQIFKKMKSFNSLTIDIMKIRRATSGLLLRKWTLVLPTQQDLEAVSE